MKKILAVNLAQCVAAAAAILFAASATPPNAHAQSKYSSDTYMLVSRADGGSVNMHVEGRGDHCWATTSEDETVGVSMGDGLCTMWDEGADDAGSLRAKIAPSKISFRLGGKSYGTSDAATVNRVRNLFAPMEDIAQKQSELGHQQRALGEKQRNLGRQQREVKVKVPDMSADISKIEADAKRLSSSGGTQSDLGELQSEIGDLQSRVGEVQSQAGEEQSKLGDQQSELGDEQSALGDQQSALGERSQGMAKDVAGKLRAMLAQAIQNGVAKPE